jgi:Zn-dependent protease with chaperone function
MDGKSLSGDQYAGLRPFYQLCWLGLACSLVALLLVSGNLQAKRLGPVVPFLPGVVAIAVAGYVGMRRRRKALAAQTDVEAGARKSETARLRRKLDGVRAKVRELSKVEDLDVLLVPGTMVSAWVARSRDRPLIQVTSAFWSVYQGCPELDGAMAHEAGHVVARDVEHFHGLYYLVAIVAGAWALFAPVALGMLLFMNIGKVLSFVVVVGIVAFSALAVGGTWSALLVARELQADAFAVDALGDAEPVTTFLDRQRELRLKEGAPTSALRAVWRWLIQPDLAWRSSLPVLYGTVGRRVELMLGVGIFGAFMVPLWTAMLVGVMLEGDTPSTGVIWPAWLVVLAVALGLLWIVYQFFWYRNQSARRDTRLVHSLRTWAWLSLPSAALFMVILLILYSLWRSTEFHPAYWLLVVAGLPLISLTVWAASNLAIVWEDGGGKTTPGIRQALAALAVVLMVGAVVTFVLFVSVGRDTISDAVTAGSFVGGFALAALAVGSWCHRTLNKRRCTDVESG